MELLTAEEHEALDKLGEAYKAISKVVGDHSIREYDMQEIVHHIHVLQRYVMSNAAARAYPGRYRALGYHIVI